jgi:hypothetical protein
MLNDYPSDLIEFARRKTTVPRKRHRLEPELGSIALAANMDMDRFGAVETVEEQPVRSWYPEILGTRVPPWLHHLIVRTV